MKNRGRLFYSRLVIAVVYVFGLDVAAADRPRPAAPLESEFEQALHAFIHSDCDDAAFVGVYRAWLHEEPLGLADSTLLNHAREFLFFPAPRGSVSRTARRALDQAVDPKDAPLALRGLQGIGYLVSKGQCDYARALSSQLLERWGSWKAETESLSPVQKYDALVGGLELTRRHRLLVWQARLDGDVGYRPEAFRQGFEQITLPVSLNALIALEQSLTAGVPFDKIDAERTLLLGIIGSRQFGIDSESDLLNQLDRHILRYRFAIESELAPALGARSGFNSLDGD